MAIAERLSELKETIKAKFLGERIFLPFDWLEIKEKFSIRELLQNKAWPTARCSTCNGYECTMMVRG